ncbi:MAG: class I SAM-dependent methyltransferase [Candidatus Nealsonbacteria bacterium]
MNFRRFRTKEVLNRLPKKIGVICDIGCGERAEFLFKLNNRIERAIGIDRKVVELPLGAMGISQDLNKYPEIDLNIKFDYVTMLAVLEHLENPERILKEAYKILKPDGKIIITTPTKRARFVLETLAFLKIIPSVKEHKQYFTRKGLRLLLLNTGFTNIKHNYFSLGFNQIIIGDKNGN